MKIAESAYENFILSERNCEHPSAEVFLNLTKRPFTSLSEFRTVPDVILALILMRTRLHMTS